MFHWLKVTFLCLDTFAPRIAYYYATDFSLDGKNNVQRFKIISFKEIDKKNWSLKKAVLLKLKSFDLPWMVYRPVCHKKTRKQARLSDPGEGRNRVYWENALSTSLSFCNQELYFVSSFFVFLIPEEVFLNVAYSVIIIDSLLSLVKSETCIKKCFSRGAQYRW